MWHGEPGTGKTHALRALSWEWREWCDFEYILDAETFLGDTNYMLSVLLREADNDDRWRLLILEDTGDLLLAGADGPPKGLSRLLNVSDGLIGQGLNVLFLVTTNERVEHLHPAITRPGRCLFDVEFAPLSYAEAKDWAKNRAFTLADRSHYRLAELFALESGDASASPLRRKLGFIA